MIGWSFPSNNDGIAAGANDGAIDAFSGNRLSSVIREVIQNSLDAKKSEGVPVKLHFSKQFIDKDIFSGFSEISKHIQKSCEMAEKQDLKDAVKFYQYGLKQIKTASTVGLFCIHDYSTSGLTGPISEPYGPWFAITKGAGISQKVSVGSLGSFGHGSKAPFSFSDTRTVFYYTKIKQKNGFEERFQGKSILQTHESPTKAGVFTQGTGFYGHTKQNKPLINDEIPNWVKSLRGAVTEDTGTSIFVPYTSFSHDLYPEAKITVVANFFYAILSGELEVTIGDDVINQLNLVDTFYECQGILEVEQDEIDVSFIKGCFESAKTIIESDFHGAQEIPTFGKILWWIRLGEGISSRSVGVSRSSGMLITRKPILLERFKGVKNFDLFVCVKGKNGSELLKTLENPTHDNFEFDRIKIDSAKKDAQRKYRIFSNRVRDVVSNYAALEIVEEESLDALSFLFDELSDSESATNKRTERGSALQLLSISNISSKLRKRHNDKLEYIEDLFGRDATMSSQGETKKGVFPRRVQEPKKIKGKPTNEVGMGSFTAISLDNLRVRHSTKLDMEAKLFFDSPVTGEFILSVYAVGEHGSELMPFIVNKIEANSLKVSVERGTRHSLDIEFKDFAKNVVLEAKLNEN